MPKGQVMVRVDVESDFWLPQWILRAKAKERVAALMARQGPTVRTVTPAELREMKPNDKVPGVFVAAPRPGRQEANLIIPSDRILSADHVRDLAGMVREGGYGKGPTFKTKHMSKEDWAKMVGNLVDWLEQRSKGKNKAHIALDGLRTT